MTEHENTETEETRAQPSRGPLARAAAVRTSSSASWPAAGADSLEFKRRLLLRYQVAEARVGYLATVINAGLDAIDDREDRSEALDRMLIAGDYDRLASRAQGFRFEVEHPLWAWQFRDVPDVVEL